MALCQSRSAQCATFLQHRHRQATAATSAGMKTQKCADLLNPS